jgi:hypothetical protein
MVLSKCTGGRLGCIMPSGDGASSVVDGARPVRGRGAVLSSLLGAVSTVALGAGAALAADDAAPRSTGEQAAVQALMAKIESMEQRINGLQAELKLAKAGGSRSSTMAQSVSPGSRLLADAKPFAALKEVKADGSRASTAAQPANKASTVAQPRPHRPRPGFQPTPHPTPIPSRRMPKRNSCSRPTSKLRLPLRTARTCSGRGQPRCRR